MPLREKLRAHLASRSARAGVVVLATYGIVTLLLAAPLLPRVRTAVANDPIDPLLNAWLLWWDATTVPLSPSWWNAPAFYPTTGVTAFSEHLLGLAVLAAPILHLTGDPLVAYNLVWLVSFPLCAFATYRLVRRLTGRHDAAFLAGLAFGFAPYRAGQLAHVQVLSAYWMPVALLACHRYLDERRGRWLAMAGGAYLMQALCNSYYLVYFPALVGLWVLWFASPRRSRAAGLRLVASLGAAFLLLLPILLQYHTIHGRYHFARDPAEIARYSADLAALVQASEHLVLWRWIGLLVRPEGELFPGVTLPLLLGVALLAARRSFVVEQPVLRWVRALAATAALAFGAAALVRTGVGPWHLDVRDTRLVWVTVAGKPLGLAAACAAVWVLATPATLAAWRRRSVLGFYVAAAVVLWLLALGPVGTFLGEPVVLNLPYAWLLRLPRLGEILRVPARFWMLATLCLAVALGCAVARLAPARPRWRAGFVLVVAGGLLADGWFALPVAEVVAPSCAERALVARGRAAGGDPATSSRASGSARSDAATEVAAVLYLPLGDPARDVGAMYRARRRGIPSVNGLSGYFAPHYTALAYGLEQGDPAMLTELSRRGDLAVVIDEAQDPDGRWREYVARHPAATLVASCGGTWVYRVRGRDASGEPEPVGLSGASQLPVVALRASVNQGKTPALLDANWRTRWEAGPQTAPASLEVDLGRPYRLRAVVTDLGAFPRDFPRLLLVDLSVDGENWTAVWRGPTHLATMRAALERPEDVALAFPLGDRMARFVRLRQVGHDAVFYWSIAELRVIGSATPPLERVVPLTGSSARPVNSVTFAGVGGLIQTAVRH